MSKSMLERAHAVRVLEHAAPGESPGATLPTIGAAWRECRSCEVKWFGTPACWVCGVDVTTLPPPVRREP